MTPEQKIKEAVKQAEAVFSRYLEPGERECHAIIEDLMIRAVGTENVCS